MNPCPCGWRGDSERECRCSGFDVQRYLARVSGPLLDRIDLQVEVGRLGADELLDAGGAGGGGGRVYDGRVTHDGGGARDSGVASAGGGMRGGGGMRDGGRVSAAMRHRVLAARRRAALRLRRAGLASNAELDARQVQRFCPLPAAGKRLLRDAIRRHGFSARACHRVMKVARTIADLTGRDAITESDVAEAIMYRVLDRREAASGGATAPAEPPAGGGRRQARRR